MKKSNLNLTPHTKSYLRVLPLLLGASALLPTSASADPIRCNEITETIDGVPATTYVCGSNGEKAYEDFIPFLERKYSFGDAGFKSYPITNHLPNTPKISIILDDKKATRLNTESHFSTDEKAVYDNAFAVVNNTSAVKEINVDLLNSGKLSTTSSDPGILVALSPNSNVEKFRVNIEKGIEAIEGSTGVSIRDYSNHSTDNYFSIDTKVNARDTGLSFTSHNSNTFNYKIQVGENSLITTKSEDHDATGISIHNFPTYGKLSLPKLYIPHDVNDPSLPGMRAKIDLKGSMKTISNSTSVGILFKTTNLEINLDQGNIYIEGGKKALGITNRMLDIDNPIFKFFLPSNKVHIKQSKDNSIILLNTNKDKTADTKIIEIESCESNIDLAGTAISSHDAILIKACGPFLEGFTDRFYHPPEQHPSSTTINIRKGARVEAGDSSHFLIKTDTSTKNTNEVNIRYSNITIDKAIIKGSISLEGLHEEANLTFNGTDLTNVGSIAASDTGVGIITFNDYKAETINTSKLHNWKIINLKHGNYNLNGDSLTIEKYNPYKVSFGIYYKDQNASKPYGLHINNATLNLNSIDRTEAIKNYNLNSDLYNEEGATINLCNNTNANTYNTLTINGDYYSTGGKIALNVASNDDQSQSDKVVINGNVHGNTLLELHRKGGIGALTTKGIKLIELSDTSSIDDPDQAFTLANSIEAGAYEYNTLAYNPENGKKGFYLQSKKNVDTSGTDQRGDSSIIDKDGRPVYNLLRKDAVAYLLNQQINAQALADLTTNLHQREGEQRAETNYLNPNQSWVRYLGNQDELTAHNLGAKTTNFGVQVGYDFRTSHNHESGLRNRTGIYAAYNKVDSTLTDSYRKEFYIPGRIDTSLGSLALYHTATLGNGYLDLVGGLHFFHNDYAIINGGEQNAFGGNLSAEAGYNLDLGNHFFVEPQVQLSYQGTRYAGFKDAVTAVKGYTHQSLRPRAGFRLGYHDLAGTNLWLHANIETELLKTAKLTIGQDVVSINRAAKTIYDLGLNGQVALSPTTVLYGSAQYKGAFTKSATLNNGTKVKTTKLQGFGAEAGLRFTW